jgi:8-oxo-dGTP pyrophosphatase MutT (NUDIX family)
MSQPDQALALLSDPRGLRARIADALFEAHLEEGRTSQAGDFDASSAVLFLIGQLRAGAGAPEPCLVLNKRSRLVKQPGDLCCPGGGISRRWDPVLARTLGLPGMPLRRWPHYRAWRDGAGDRRLPLMLAAALREAFEEMRLNPLATTFLGLLPPQPLYLRGRAIRPAVSWLRRPQTFRPNWEVDKIVVVPLRTLLDPSNHARVLVHFAPGFDPGPSRPVREFPCVLLRDGDGEEILWGATWRIISRFLSLVFGFVEPPLDTLPGRELTLDEAYLSGRVAG